MQVYLCMVMRAGNGCEKGISFARDRERLGNSTEKVKTREKRNIYVPIILTIIIIVNNNNNGNQIYISIIIFICREIL